MLNINIKFNILILKNLQRVNNNMLFEGFFNYNLSVSII